MGREDGPQNRLARGNGHSPAVRELFGHQRQGDGRGSSGLYAICDRLPAKEMESLLAALRAAPAVRVMPHSDSPAVMKTLEGALGRAGYCLEPIPMHTADEP